MAASGIVSKPDFAVFADTQWEPPYVYEHLNWLEERLDFPVHRATAGDIREGIITQKDLQGRSYIQIPTFALKDGDDAKDRGMRTRQCTSNYKITVIHKVIREKVLEGTGRKKLTKSTPVIQLFGISSDEVYRVKDARESWSTNRYPLVDMGMTRADCHRWFSERFPDHKLPRSACIGCPYHSDAEWAEMLRERPDEFEDAVEVDNSLRIVRDDTPYESYVHYNRDTGKRVFQYLHPSCQPLESLKSYFEGYIAPDKAGQLGMMWNDNWNNECEGMCGV